ncbi:hypothetical protein DCE93_01355 [Agromyces badenianii]|uniref:Uncharacterized protein n=1 Tax=Agromyces badenianii TaxID=2080742 RepID=A0A2S0WTB6_9MICO|nr:hypothetical protein [Agromyces badenianii]AWB94484.1 hypothetical protein DCE93_01355 [Agromyces badenianii]
MGDPRGQTPHALTDPENDLRPDADTGAPPNDDAARRRMRDLPPSTIDGPSLSDPDAQQLDADPLDARKPGIQRNDPLDPDGHVI